MPFVLWRSWSAAAVCAALALAANSLSAQQIAAQPTGGVSPVNLAESLPDAPGFTVEQQRSQSAGASAESTSSTSAPAESTADAGAVVAQKKVPPPQTQRVLGIMPNFSAVTADTILPPQSPRQKFVMAAKNSFDYSSFVLTGIQSSISMASDSYPEFHQGVAGYGRYYYHTLLDTADENFQVAGIWPILFRQDTRFYTLGHGGFRRRAFHAATRVLVTRTDSGNNTFNASEIVGAGAAAGFSTVYYPSQYRTWTKVGQKWLTSTLIDATNNVFKEYWPDINRFMFHTK